MQARHRLPGRFPYRSIHLEPPIPTPRANPSRAPAGSPPLKVLHDLAPALHGRPLSSQMCRHQDKDGDLLAAAVVSDLLRRSSAPTRSCRPSPHRWSR